MPILLLLSLHYSFFRWRIGGRNKTHHYIFRHSSHWIIGPHHFTSQSTNRTYKDQHWHKYIKYSLTIFFPVGIKSIMTLLLMGGDDLNSLYFFNYVWDVNYPLNSKLLHIRQLSLFIWSLAWHQFKHTRYK